MIRSFFFIDGFNLYHSIKKANDPRLKWLDLKTLVSNFIMQNERIEEILYCTALSPWDQSKANKHKIYLKALENSGVVIHRGKFKKVHRKCRGTCNEVYETYEEKFTDVNLGIQIFRHAGLDLYDKAYLISGDTDFVPAIKAVKEDFPNKKFVIIFPFKNPVSYDLKNNCDHSIYLKKVDYKRSRFPDTIAMTNGSTIQCPSNWK